MGYFWQLVTRFRYALWAFRNPTRLSYLKHELETDASRRIPAEYIKSCVTQQDLREGFIDANTGDFIPRMSGKAAWYGSFLATLPGWKGTV